jgi:alanyl-tRNA synthetase
VTAPLRAWKLFWARRHRARAVKAIDELHMALHDRASLGVQNADLWSAIMRGVDALALSRWLRADTIAASEVRPARQTLQILITDLGEVYSPDMVAEVAERLSFLETAKWSLAAGSFRNQLFLSLRVSDRRMRAGKLIRDVCADFGGSAGGHGSMAGARIPLTGTGKQRTALKRELFRRFLEAFGVPGERGVSLLLAANQA